MNTVTVSDHTLVVEPTGLDKVWSFTRKLEIPIGHVRDATHDPGMPAEPKGRRSPGLRLPGKWSGTFDRDGETTFWNVSGDADTVVIELTDEHFDRLVLSVEDPAATVDLVNAATQAA